ncbi:PQQ-dependent sugar dehydrogenase [Luteimicrobium sp. DT211]|uniref:PQQ-dependent sugar dehydrogenase n=1 Tax=Luteimicrobium sp. DT211 TaxID=3393412 RepID=UPI003CE67762
MTHAASPRALRLAVAGAAAALALAACTGSSPAPSPSSVSPPTTPATTAGSPTSPATSSGTGGTSSSGNPTLPPEAGNPKVTVLATHLDTPWGLAALPGGKVLVTERDAAHVVVVDLASGGQTEVGGAGSEELRSTTVHRQESGLLGVAVSPSFASDGRVFLYRTTAQGNEVVRAKLTLGSSPSLAELTPIVTGIPSAQFHNGGRLAFGPDGDLYVTTGDATDGQNAQNPDSLGGKILRVTQDGKAAPDNPSGTRVWTLGHRNVQGLGWDATRRMFASEFGQDTWDELNQIVPGKNYGWPNIEGKQSAGAGSDPSNPPADYMDPLVTWRTDEASPSGLAVSDAAIYVAALGGLGGSPGAALWRVPLEPAAKGSPTSARATVATPQRLLHGTYGRLRTVMLDPTVKDTASTDTLLVLTSNTDGRGTPSSDDDRLLRVVVPNAG